MPKIMATYNKNEMLPQRKDALTQWGQHLRALIDHVSDDAKIARKFTTSTLLSAEVATC